MLFPCEQESLDNSNDNSSDNNRSSSSDDNRSSSGLAPSARSTDAKRTTTTTTTTMKNFEKPTTTTQSSLQIPKNRKPTSLPDLIEKTTTTPATTRRSRPSSAEKASLAEGAGMGKVDCRSTGKAAGVVKHRQGLGQAHVSPSQPIRVRVRVVPSPSPSSSPRRSALADKFDRRRRLEVVRQGMQRHCSIRLPATALPAC
ncbi:hypothetical protein ESCO_004464 [Escovopsis weberi]|uniref:Uncharacterized protein n=1 Tax=Escovopsis weberi TaxID=150374 RepID=A0A0M8MXF3_ESCWE|nr:hypothetical protein ESCO_004464 [Escovopsis weberi]